MQVYNTLTRQKEEFKPIKAGEVLFYQCGPTVYWTQHIGNLRAMVLADIIRRTFEYNGYKVNFARNYTDVGHLTGDNLGDADSGEDRMEKGAKREGLTPDQIANKYIKVFEEDTKELNVLEPTHKPRATEYVKEMQVMVQDLIAKGFAYVTPLAVYFDVTKAKDYTRLSKQNLAANRQGAGHADIEDPEKKHPEDFSLWFFRAGTHANALQFWPSPFISPLVENGNGFPGWAIECSAMAKKLLGETIDVHMGGVEHIPIHHTNEIAQSESANSKTFVNYWLHNEWLLVNNGKMSKSEGTGYSLTEVKEKGFNPLALRYFFLQAHYRSKQNFTWEGMQSAATGYERLLKNVKALGSTVGKVDEKLRTEFIEKINNDFSAPQGLAMVFAVLKSDLSKEDKIATIVDFDKVLGLDLSPKP
jgi:cysteinyl-tRNA synthetase